MIDLFKKEEIYYSMIVLRMEKSMISTRMSELIA